MIYVTSNVATNKKTKSSEVKRGQPIKYNMNLRPLKELESVRVLEMDEKGNTRPMKFNERNKNKVQVSLYNIKERQHTMNRKYKVEKDPTGNALCIRRMA